MQPFYLFIYLFVFSRFGREALNLLHNGFHSILGQILVAFDKDGEVQDVLGFRVGINVVMAAIEISSLNVGRAWFLAFFFFLIHLLFFGIIFYN